MTDVELVLHKLQRLRAQVATVRQRRPANASSLDTDGVLRDAIALAFLVAAQEAIDIAYHLAADEGWGLADSHRAAFELLAAHGILSAEHAAELAALAQERDRIVHGYASVDHQRFWAELPAGLSALERYAAALAAWLPEP